MWFIQAFGVVGALSRGASSLSRAWAIRLHNVPGDLLSRYWLGISSGRVGSVHRAGWEEVRIMLVAMKHHAGM
ncbi:hypothetical protein K466DRAFT_585418 [Polyporus arcularius HHB13444]|uniref:Uncharacterized protein n=1 Tax=Polyporus arcularius HHB13444 TaxID=1314778 RepID=A0A5C3PG96_9APHY|nr:hypothetical protein K466DRAFT_585418 [Polyporus arcularius HHB13444]